MTIMKKCCFEINFISRPVFSFYCKPPPTSETKFIKITSENVVKYFLWFNMILPPQYENRCYGPDHSILTLESKVSF